MGLLDSLKELISKEETAPAVAVEPPVAAVEPVVEAPAAVLPVEPPPAPAARASSHRSGDHHPTPWRCDFRSAHR